MHYLFFCRYNTYSVLYNYRVLSTKNSKILKIYHQLKIYHSALAQNFSNCVTRTTRRARHMTSGTRKAKIFNIIRIRYIIYLFFINYYMQWIDYIVLKSVCIIIYFHLYLFLSTENICCNIVNMHHAQMCTYHTSTRTVSLYSKMMEKKNSLKTYLL